MSRISRFALALVLAAFSAACATSLRNPQIADLQQNPGRYQDRSININGVVTNSWGTPFVPLRFYKVDDGTGEVTVVSQQGSRTPTKGARVEVKAEEIFDYIFSKPDGTREGNETGPLIEARAQSRRDKK